MFETEQTDFAIASEQGFDLFTRVHDTGQKRARYRCYGMIVGSDQSFVDFEPQSGRDRDAQLALVKTAQNDPLLTQSFSLGDAQSWPRAQAGQSPLRLFLHHEFFRAWLVADMATARLLAQLEAAPESLPMEPGKISGAVLPVFDFNALNRGQALARLIVPVLKTRVQNPGFRDDGSSSTGYALRMLGDLCLRANNPELALACFETAVLAGDNAFRRRKAIDAALAAGQSETAKTHLAAYAQRWRVPDDLASLLESAAP